MTSEGAKTTATSKETLKNRLYRHLQKQGQESTAALSKWAGESRDKVFRLLKHLEDDGLITTRREKYNRIWEPKNHQNHHA